MKRRESVTNLALLVLFVKDDIDDEAYNDKGNAAELYSIIVVPSQEVAQDKKNGANNHHNDADALKKTFHFAIAIN